MATLDLRELDIPALESLIAEAKKLIETKRKEQRENAIGEALRILDKAGISQKEFAKIRKRAASPALKRGARYVNPDNPSQVWTVGKGRRPKWFASLAGKGKLPEPQ